MKSLLTEVQQVLLVEKTALKLIETGSITDIDCFETCRPLQGFFKQKNIVFKVVCCTVGSKQ